MQTVRRKWFRHPKQALAWNKINEMTTLLRAMMTPLRVVKRHEARAGDTKQIEENTNEGNKKRQRGLDNGSFQLGRVPESAGRSPTLLYGLNRRQLFGWSVTQVHVGLLAFLASF